MIFPGITSIPAEDDRDEPHRGSQYISRKDIKWLVIAAVILVLVGYPVYRHLKDESDWHVCGANLNAIYQSMSLYAADHDDRFPPIAWEADATTGAPMIINGKVTTWVTQAFSYDQHVEHFECPSATRAEGVPTDGAITDSSGMTRVTIYSDYGMYEGYSAASKSDIERSSQVVFLSETSNFGAERSYDPMPFKDAAGRAVPYDGYSIAWDDSNAAPDGSSKKITRLSFRDSENGIFSSAFGRHEQGLHAITPDGNTIILHPGDAVMSTRGGVPTGLWQTPAIIGQ